MYPYNGSITNMYIWSIYVKCIPLVQFNLMWLSFRECHSWPWTDCLSYPSLHSVPFLHQSNPPNQPTIFGKSANIVRKMGIIYVTSCTPKCMSFLSRRVSWEHELRQTAKLPNRAPSRVPHSHIIPQKKKKKKKKKKKTPVSLSRTLEFGNEGKR